MRSIPVALIWELLYCGRWMLLLGIFGAPALPIFLLTSLSNEGVLDPTEPGIMAIQVGLMQMNIMVFGSTVLAAQRPPTRLASYPLSTVSLVTWHVAPAMVLMILQTYFSTLLLNVLFDANWPLWGPSLFAAVAIVAVQSVHWQSDNPLWLAVGFGTVGAILGLWFKSRYGALFSMPQHLWLELTGGEILTLLAFAILAFYFSILGAARKRRGDAITSLGILAWLDRLFEPATEISETFKSAQAAQSWFEWRTKGWALPASAIFTMAVGLASWVIFSRDLKDLVLGAMAAGGLLSGLAIVGGLITGTMGPQDGMFEMGHFLATRPITSSDLARTILKTTAKSVFTTWTIWATVFVMICGIAIAADKMPSFAEMNHFRWWFFPTTLFGPWIVISIGASCGMTGRPWIFVTIFSVLIICSLFVSIWARNMLSSDTRVLLAQGLTLVTGSIFVIGTAWVFVVAWRRQLIRTLEVSLAAGIWFVLSLVVALEWEVFHSDPISVNILIIGCLALAAAPVAAAPLAIAWNRNR
ncbi:MAG: hypothetical protein JWM11_7678 [Planctomycetaceae bacterium]|nr:hypothetical protein [Planctomycetaceae bacterium]